MTALRCNDLSPHITVCSERNFPYFHCSLCPSQDRRRTGTVSKPSLPLAPLHHHGWRPYQVKHGGDGAGRSLATVALGFSWLRVPRRNLRGPPACIGDLFSRSHDPPIRHEVLLGCFAVPASRSEVPAPCAGVPPTCSEVPATDRKVPPVRREDLSTLKQEPSPHSGLFAVSRSEFHDHTRSAPVAAQLGGANGVNVPDHAHPPSTAVKPSTKLAIVAARAAARWSRPAPDGYAFTAPLLRSSPHPPAPEEAESGQLIRAGTNKESGAK